MADIETENRDGEEEGGGALIRESKVQKRCREGRGEEREGQGKEREEELLGLLQHQASLSFLVEGRISA